MLLALIKKELLALVRDVHGLAALFVMPVIFIIIMSLALKDYYSPPQRSLRYAVDAQGMMQAVHADQLSKPEQVVLPALTLRCMGIGNGWQVYADALNNFNQQLITIEFNHHPQAQDVAILAQIEWQAARVIAPELALPVYLRNNVAVKGDRR